MREKPSYGIYLQHYLDAVALLHIKLVDPSFPIEDWENLDFLELPSLARAYWAKVDLLFPEIPEINLTLDI